MRPIKTYQVAHRFPQFRPSSPALDRSLSQDIKHINLSKEVNKNIFQNNEELRLRNLKWKKEQPYNIVGMKQFHIYNKIKQKKRNDLHTNQQLIGSFATYGSQKVDTRTSVLHNFLTRQEVLNKQSYKELHIHANRILNEQLICSSAVTKSRVSPDLSFCLSMQQSANLDQTINRECFSLAKLKQKMEKYRTGWDKTSRRKVQQDNQLVVTRERRLYNYLSEKTLNKLQVKRLLVGDSKNISQQTWIQSLRSDSLNSNLIVKQKEVVDSQGIKASGLNKLKKEKDWIEEKYKQGFFFSKMEACQ